MEWDGEGNIVEGDSGGDCDDEDGFCEGGMDYPTGAGAYDIGYGCPCLDPNSPNYNPEQYDTADGLDPTDNTANPCDPAGCMDENALNYDPAAEVADAVLLVTDNDVTVAAMFGTLGISDCSAVIELWVTTSRWSMWMGRNSSPFGLRLQWFCLWICPAVTVLG